MKALTISKKQTPYFKAFTAALVVLALSLFQVLNSSSSVTKYLEYIPEYATTTIPWGNEEEHVATVAEKRNESLFPPPRDHPFAGARDANGNWGYVADPLSVRKRILKKFRSTQPDRRAATLDDMILARYMPLTNKTEGICDVKPGKGFEREGFDILAKKVVVGGPVPLPACPGDPREPAGGWEGFEGNFSGTADEPPYLKSAKPPRIFCGVYTYHGKPLLQEQIANTWAWRCDGYLAFSDETIESLGAVDLAHFGDESYLNMWQKVRSIWMYIYMNYLDDYDYFHLCGDDNVIVPENLRNYLWSINDENRTKPLYLGSYAKLQGIYLCGGGSGYTLNRPTIEFLARKFISNPDTKRAPNEDAMMGMTLIKFVRCYRTQDANGAMRYIGTSPDFLVKRPFPTRYRFVANQIEKYQKFVGKNLTTGSALTSSQAISWHWLRGPTSIARIYAIMYRTCPKGTVLGDSLAEIDRQLSHDDGGADEDCAIDDDVSADEDSAIGDDNDSGDNDDGADEDSADEDSAIDGDDDDDDDDDGADDDGATDDDGGGAEDDDGVADDDNARK